MIEAVANHLWQSTLFLLAAGALTLAFRRDRASVRFGIFLAASLKFLIPFSLLSCLGAQLAWRTTFPVTATAHLALVMEPIARAGNSVMHGLTITSGEHAPARPHWVVWALLAIWLAGFLALSGRRTRDWWRLRTIVQIALPVAIAAPIPVRQAAPALQPAVCGIFRPVLLLPADIACHLAPEQLEAVLAHELCHWRRQDNLTAAIHMLVEALFWFHPLVWWLGQRLVTAREQACDEAVIAGGVDRRAYAASILTVCRMYLEPPAPCTSAVSGGSLRQRIEDIMTKPVSLSLSVRKQCLLAAVALGVITAPLAVGLAAGSPAQAHGASPSDTSQMTHYRSAAWGFELDVPRGWNAFPPPRFNRYEVIRFASDEQGMHALDIVRLPYDHERSTADFLAQTQQAMAKLGFSSFVKGEATIGSKQVPTLDFQKTQGQLVHCRQYYIIDGTLLYLLSFSTDRPEAMMDQFAQVAASFTYTDRPEAAMRFDALLAAAAVPAAALVQPNFRDAPLTRVAEVVGQATGKNFIIDPRVQKALITMLSSKPITTATFYRAFLSSLEELGIRAELEDDAVKLVPATPVHR